jgi:hypothetical protein
MSTTTDRNTMKITIPEADLLAVLGENGEHWIQGEWGDDQSMCLHGAIRRCQPIEGDAYIIEQVAAHLGWGTYWNDAHTTNWALIRARLARVEVTDADLADTFGPQWEHIVTLVRRCAILTGDEQQRLDAARVASAADAARNAARAAAWFAAGAAARDAAGDAALEAARDAAGVAARDAAGDAARFAAGDAARALVVRDLIGQHAFTQQHYDLLTDPWRTVIGPVHPDDKPVSQ